MNRQGARDARKAERRDRQFSLPLGLTESAVDAVRSWKFKPSTLNEKPVEVLYILTVRFNLQ